jgi:hypothetical protein
MCCVGASDLLSFVSLVTNGGSASTDGTHTHAESFKIATIIFGKHYFTCDTFVKSLITC